MLLWCGMEGTHIPTRNFQIIKCKRKYEYESSGKVMTINTECRRINSGYRWYDNTTQHKKSHTRHCCKCSQRSGAGILSVVRRRATEWRNSNFSCLSSNISWRTLQPKMYNTCKDSVTKVTVNHDSQITYVYLIAQNARSTSKFCFLLLNSSPKFSAFSKVQLRWSASFANNIWIKNKK